MHDINFLSAQIHLETATGLDYSWAADSENPFESPTYHCNAQERSKDLL